MPRHQQAYSTGQLSVDDARSKAKGHSCAARLPSPCDPVRWCPDLLQLFQVQSSPVYMSFFPLLHRIRSITLISPRFSLLACVSPPQSAAEQICVRRCTSLGNLAGLRAAGLEEKTDILAIPTFPSESRADDASSGRGIIIALGSASPPKKKADSLLLQYSDITSSAISRIVSKLIAERLLNQRMTLHPMNCRLKLFGERGALCAMAKIMSCDSSCCAQSHDETESANLGRASQVLDKHSGNFHRVQANMKRYC